MNNTLKDNFVDVGFDVGACKPWYSIRNARIRVLLAGVVTELWLMTGTIQRSQSVKGLFLGYILTTDVKRTHVIAFPGGLSALDVHVRLQSRRASGRCSGRRRRISPHRKAFPGQHTLPQSSLLDMNVPFPKPQPFPQPNVPSFISTIATRKEHTFA